jgi:hypothetical protein
MSSVDDDIERMLETAQRKVDTRREMKSRQAHNTPYGQIRFYLGVDLPADMPEDVFKKSMSEYGMILHKAFKE